MKLSLSREALIELSDLDLAGLAGAAVAESGKTCPIQSCLCISNIGECITWSCNVVA